MLVRVHMARQAWAIWRVVYVVCRYGVKSQAILAIRVVRVGMAQRLERSLSMRALG